MAKVSALFNLGPALEAIIEVGRRAAAGDPVAVSGLPTMTLSPATRENLTTYLKNPEALDSRQRNVLEKYLIRSSQEGSSWGSRERMRQSGVTEYTGEAQERRIITPEQLYNEQANLAPVMGDKSVTGREIVSVQGVPLSKAVMGDGGPGYAQAWEDFNVAWASMEGAAKAKQAHFDKIARDTNGKAPVGVYMAMTDVAMDFNTMTSEGLIRQFKNLDVSKSDKKAFDEAVRESIPEWAGIDSPDAIDQIYGNVPLTSTNKKGDALPSSALRKRLVFEFGKKKWQDKGFPVYDDVIVAFTEPALRDAKLGDSGFTMFDTIPGADVVPVVGHNTYDTSIMGKYKGGFEQSVPTEIMFPKLWADLEGQMTVPKEGSKSAPRLLNRQEKIGAIRLGHGYQPADQAWLDGISSWLEKNKGTASSALLATLVSAGIITPQDAEAGVITGFAKGGREAADMMLQNVVDEAARLTKQGFPEDTAMRIATGELPMDAASRNARAKGVYNTDDTYYHGTNADIQEFRPSVVGNLGEGVYVTPDPKQASSRAAITKYRKDLKGNAGPNVLPVYMRDDLNFLDLNENPLGRIDVARLKALGYDGIRRYENDELKEVNIFDPANIRSTNAAFDPANKGKSALLGGLGGAAVVGGSMTPEEAQAGPLKSGTDAVTELARRAAQGDVKAAEGIRAYHGSPHDFDRFSTESIGTGEGAQAYGHGLYFAESEDVAKSYREALTRNQGNSSPSLFIDGKEAPLESIQDQTIREELQRYIDAWDDDLSLSGKDIDIDEAMDNIIFDAKQERSSRYTTEDEYPEIDQRIREAERLKASGKLKIVDSGRMYEVNIDATPDDFLDYDLPLSQQSDKVRSSVSGMLKSKGFDDSQIQAIIDRDIDGQELNAMLGSFDESKGVKHMTGQGIKGIRYKDGFSRGADGGSSNYVVFDDKLIDITKKYGVGPVAAAAILAGTMTPEEAQSSQAGMGGMGVRSAPTAQTGLGGMGVQMPQQRPEPTGADLMQQANDDFMSGIVNQPEPDFLNSVQQSLLSGIMKTAGIADLSADIASAMFAPVMSAPGAVARYATGSTADEIAQARRETEDYFNYQPRTELGPQYGEQAMQAIGGAVSPYIPAIKEAAGESYILGAMKQGYDYLGEREKELAKALMDLSPY